MNGANAPPAPSDAPRAAAERELRVALGLLLVRDREHPAGAAGLRRAYAATMPVVPPTEPAVCTRNIGLPVAPSASVRYSSGFITPSNRSGALPSTTASMSATSSRRRRARGARPRGRARRSDTSSRRLLVVGLADPDDRARLVRSLASRPSRMQTRFCCRHGPDVECASVRCLPPSKMWSAASAMRHEAGGHDRVGGERAARRVHGHVGAEAERLDAAAAPRG